MSKKTPSERLVMARMRAGYATASDAARAYGWNENTYRSHENGERGLKQLVALKYARAYNVDVAFILLDEKYDIEENSSIAQIGGSIGNFGRVNLYFERADGPFISQNFNRSKAKHFARLPVYPNYTPLAFEVDLADSSHPFAPGDLVLVEDEPRSTLESIGRWCLIEVPGMEFLLRFSVRSSQPKLFNIQTSLRQEEILVSPSWIGFVIAIIPAGSWDREDHHGLVAFYEQAEKESGA